MMQNYHSEHHAKIIEIWFEAYFHPLRNTAAASGEVIVIQSNLSSVNTKIIWLMKQLIFQFEILQNKCDENNSMN
jgi:hypothetical protein